MLLLLPVAAVGAAIHYPLYRLIGFLATRFARGEEEMVATIKAVGGMVFYPLLWIALAIWAGVRLGVVWGVTVVIALPLLAWLALRVFEALDDVVGRMRSAVHADLEPRRHELIGEFVSIAEEMGLAGR